MTTMTEAEEAIRLAAALEVVEQVVSRFAAEKSRFLYLQMLAGEMYVAVESKSRQDATVVGRLRGSLDDVIGILDRYKLGESRFETIRNLDRDIRAAAEVSRA